MGRRGGFFLICVFSCGVVAHAVRPPDSREAPLGLYDVRSRQGGAEVRREDVVSLKNSLRSSVFPQTDIRLDSTTGRLRQMYSLNGRLSAPSLKSAPDIAKEFVSAHPRLFGLSRDEISAMTIGDQYDHPKGLSRHLFLQQRCSGFDVFQARLQFVLDAQGRLIHVAGNCWPGLKPPAKSRLSPLEAVQWAAAHCDRSQRRGGTITPRTSLRPGILSSEQGVERLTIFAPGPFRDPVTARLVVMPSGDQAIPAWEMRLHVSPQECYEVLVDARDGTLLYRANLYSFAQPAGLVFPQNPDAGARQMESFVGDPIASPLGWCDAISTATQGNNVLAREDADGNNETVPGIQPFKADRQFVFPFSNCWASDPHTTATDVNAVVTNLFYLTNWYHDYLYELGFDEASGNFQQDNFGRGGQGRDRIFADAMDGGTRNTANFLTLPDGDPPGPYGGHSRLQVSLFSPLLPLYPLYRDGDLDGDVVLHECTHGMTARMVGGPSNVLALQSLQASAVAEGWSDFLPCSVFDDPVMAEYVTGNTVRGARHSAYDVHPWLFRMMGNTFEVTTPTLPAGGPFDTIFVPESHDDGEIWAAALWALRTELDSPRLAEYLVVEALRYTPPDPTVLEARDAILLADALWFQGKDRDAIWRAFARRGMGWSAQAEAGSKAMLVFQSFDWPPAMGGDFTTGTAIFSDNMEGPSAGWTVRENTAGNGVAFHLTTHRRASGTKSWYFGRENLWNYDTGFREWSTLESPPIALPAATGCFLEFKHWRLAEDGISWDDAPYYFDPGFVYVRPLGTSEYNQLGFVFQNTAGWDTRRIDLTRYAGRTVQIGFYFDTWDANNNAFEGWYIDDVRVIQSRTSNIPPTAARPPWSRYQ